MMEQHIRKKGTIKLHEKCSVDGAMKGKREKKWDKNRKAEICEFPKCPNKGNIYARLTRHVSSQHKIDRYQYDHLLGM